MTDTQPLHWNALIQEVNGTKGWPEFKVWRLGLTAQHQANWWRGKLFEEMEPVLEQYRSEFGLPPLPDIDHPIYLRVAATIGLPKRKDGRRVSRQVR